MKHANTSLRSRAWLKHDRSFVTDRFIDVGFEHAEEIMDLRVFDMLNLNRIDAEAGKEMILALYRKYNPNTIIDRGMEQREIDQYYPCSEWRKKHKDLSKVLVRDLVMAENINRKAILHFYDSILKAFYKSQEYNCREYRFQDYWDLLQMKKEKKK